MKSNQPAAPILVLLSVLALAAVRGPAAADWAMDGANGLNNSQAKQAGFPAIASHGGAPVVAYTEDVGTTMTTFRMYVKQLTGSTWNQLGGTLSDTSNFQDSYYPDLVSTGPELWTVFPQYQALALTKTSKIETRSWNGATWQDRGLLYVDTWTFGDYPSITQYNGTPWVAWQEDPDQYTVKPAGTIYVSHHNGTSWETPVAVSDSVAANADHPDIAVNPVTGVPYVTYRTGGSDIYVKFYNGTGWEQMGPGPLNSGLGSSYTPTLDSDGTDIMVAFAYWVTGIEVYAVVKRWNGTDWDLVGGRPASLRSYDDTWWPVVKLYNHEPYVGFLEGYYFPPCANYLRKYNGTSWETLAGPFQANAPQNPFETDMNIVNGTPYMTWYEPLASTGVNIVYAGHYLPGPTATPGPPIPTATPSPSPTPRQSPTITPTATVYALADNVILAYPNPARDTVTFGYRLDSPADITVDIFNLAGIRVASLKEISKPAALAAKTVWRVQGLGNGVYLCRVSIQPLDGSPKREKTIKVAVVN